ncbi:MBL fold metallo-hydrolase [Temperatibacter marinus]|uniref:MBL fold metallo-hydrolase n=1 Tax=Temperatibacter marinus TaxID=1456591 RepID=A0AA52EHL8_9PROT|nr:MBL fold metallo-hydrolase [Temperatibacter marinus]WND02682.1 MBL fold metallo-hydrolase [Temperatibacter marinus]
MKYIIKFLFLACLIGNTSIAPHATASDFDMPPQQLGKNVYSLVAPAYGRPTAENKGWNSNSYFIITSEGVLVIDTGSSETIGRAIIKAIRSITDQPIRWVINSHSHADHWFGNAVFKDINAEIISTAKAVATMKQDGKADAAAFNRMTKGTTGTIRFTYPETLAKHEQIRTFGKTKVKFIFSQDGHSPGDVMVWLPEQRIIIGGDVLNSEWMPIMTHHGDLKHLVKSLKAVALLNPAIVLPGHGKPTNGNSVLRDATLLESVISVVKKGKAHSHTPDQIFQTTLEEIGPIYRTHYNDFDNNIKYLVTMITRSI